MVSPPQENRFLCQSPAAHSHIFSYDYFRPCQIIRLSSFYKYCQVVFCPLSNLLILLQSQHFYKRLFYYFSLLTTCELFQLLCCTRPQGKHGTFLRILKKNPKVSTLPSEGKPLHLTSSVKSLA